MTHIDLLLLALCYCTVVLAVYKALKASRAHHGSLGARLLALSLRMDGDGEEAISALRPVRRQRAAAPASRRVSAGSPGSDPVAQGDPQGESAASCASG